MRVWVAAVLVLGITRGTMAGHTNNILITGYWPPTNEMVRHFSTDPVQNPLGWMGDNWEGRGYNIYSFFPEFPGRRRRESPRERATLKSTTKIPPKTGGGSRRTSIPSPS